MRHTETPYAHLSDHQRGLADQFEQEAGTDGADLRDRLNASDLNTTDKAALAQAWGGPEAAAEYHTDTRADANGSARLDREQLARDLYIHAHDGDGAPQSWRDAGAQEWDSGQAKPEDVADCYDHADQTITHRRDDADEY